MPNQTNSASDREARATTSPAPSLPMPGLPFSIDPKRVLWYGGLAALVTVGVLNGLRYRECGRRAREQLRSHGVTGSGQAAAGRQQLSSSLRR